jgi:hypothetical protein
MNLNLWQQTKPVGINQLVMALYKASAENVLFASFPLPGPYSGQTQLHTFAGIPQVTYKYKLYESPDGTATGVVRNYFDIEPGQNTYNTRTPLYLVADTSAFFPSGGTSYGPDSSLIGWNWRLERVGQGSQRPDVKYVKTKGGIDTTIDDTDADGWRVAIEGDVIGQNEEWVIHFERQLAASTTGDAPSLIKATNILTANTTLDNSCIGQSYWLMGAAGFFEVQLPDLNTVPDNEPVYFLSDDGSHVNVSVKCFPGQVMQYYKSAGDLTSRTRATRYILGQQEKQAFYKITLPDGSLRWLLLFPTDGAAHVGRLVHSWDRAGINEIFLDGTTGLSKSVYVRLWERISASPEAIVPAANWNITQTLDGIVQNVNHGKFSDNGATFGLPKVYEYGFLRAKSGASGGSSSDGYAGDFQSLQLKTHKHEQTVGNIPGSPNGFGDVQNYGKYNGQINIAQDLTDIPWRTVGPSERSQKLVALGNENRPDNIGVYISMKI